MRKLQNYYIKALKMVREEGIKPGTITACTVNTRAKRRWGLCRYNSVSGTYSLNISSRLLEEDVPEDSLMSVLVHEILHTTDAVGHGPKWKAYAAQMMRAYPNLKIERTNSAEELGVKSVASEARRRPTKVYRIQCAGPCGCTHSSSRLSSTIKHPEMYRCRNGYRFRRVL